MGTFARCFVIPLVLILLLLALYSVAIDPYAAFRSPTFAGLNKYQVTALNFMRLVKPYHVNLLDYEVLITGSSRAGRGLDCRYFLARGERCYNSALTGGSIHEAYRFLQQKPVQLRRAVVSLDFFVFLRDHDAHEAFVEERLLRTVDGQLNPAYPGQAINDMAGLLFSRKTLVSARNTRKWQHLPYMNRQADGMLHLDDWGGWSFDPATLDPGKKNQRVNRQVLRYQHIIDTMRDYYSARATQLPAARENMRRHLGGYARLLRLIYQQELPATLVLSPSHASYWVLLRRQGFYPMFEQWKRHLVRINEDLARQHSRPPLPLFDFSGANPVAVGAAPRRDEPATFNHLFTDTMHFSRALGTRMLDRAMGACDNRDGALFGYCLRSDSIEELLQQQAALLKTYEQDKDSYRKSAFELAPGTGSAR